jgi:DNA polymerase-3 subunit epsilon
VAHHLGIEFQHHVAEEDARVAGEILLRAIAETGIGAEGWLHRSTESVGGSIAREGLDGAPLYGETIVFTGALSIPRREAASMAAAVGCAVCESVNRTTTILVVGDQDIGRLAGHDRSSKHRRAENLIERGQEIRILVESDFRRLVQLEGTV